MRRQKIANGDLDRFIACLFAIRGWASASDCAKILGLKDTRAVRALACASGGRIISGSKCYRLKRFASTDEKKKAVARLNNQIHSMQQRVTEIEASDEPHPDQHEFGFVAEVSNGND